MNKRICVLGTGDRPASRQHVSAILGDWASEQFRVELLLPRLSVFPGNPEQRALSELGYIDAGLAAADSGADALFINTVGDYGLYPLRGLVDIPVIGAGESSYLAACALAPRFAVVTIWPPKLRFLHDDALKRYQMTERCAGIFHVSSDPEMASTGDPGFIEELRRCDLGLIERVVETCYAALRNSGVSTLILGCTCMSGIRDRLARDITATILDPMRVGYQYTEFALRSGARHLRDTYRDHAPSREELELGVNRAIEQSRPG